MNSSKIIAIISILLFPFNLYANEALLNSSETGGVQIYDGGILFKAPESCDPKSEKTIWNGSEFQCESDLFLEQSTGADAWCHWYRDRYMSRYIRIKYDCYNSVRWADNWVSLVRSSNISAESGTKSKSNVKYYLVGNENTGKAKTVEDGIYNYHFGGNKAFTPRGGLYGMEMLYYYPCKIEKGRPSCDTSKRYTAANATRVVPRDCGPGISSWKNMRIISNWYKRYGDYYATLRCY